MKALFANVLALLLVAVATVGVLAAEIAVVISSDANVYQEALDGFREVVGHRISSVQTLRGNPATWRDELKKLRSTIEPDLVFVIGTSALQAVAGDVTNIPIVHALVFNPAGSMNSAGKNITGIAMNPSPSQVYSLVKELNPKYRRVGTMVDPSRSASLLQQARRVFEKAGLQLIAREIRSAGEVGGVLKSLEKDIDILWLWPDEAFLADEIVQRVLLFSFASKIPVLGLSERHTEMGALLSLSYGNARDMGRQAAEIATRLLRGGVAAAAPISSPREVRVTVNLKTARRLDVHVPDSIIRRADNGVKAPVYKEGDWWVFRTRTIYPEGKTDIESHRVFFKNGRFESDDPAFLGGTDLSTTPSFLPFASVYVSDQHRKWLDFPLLPGRTWSFTYPRITYFDRRAAKGEAEVEVVGPTSKPVKTAAGVFDAVEISRWDSLNVPARLTYYYSPLTKSVVKLKAEILTGTRRSSERQFELELITYGTEGTEKNSLR